jgi:hypothetical protein
MADEQPTERNVHITPTVNVGTASDQTKVSGANVTVQSAGTVNVHGDTAQPPSLRSVVFVGILAFLGAVLVNIATSQLLPGLQPYLWLSWPLAVLVTGISIWVAYRQSRREGSNIAVGSTLEQRNRRAMLAKVKTIWIEGFLEQSLAKELRIALNLTSQPEALELPLNAQYQELNHPPRPLPTGTSISEVFKQMGGALLILGAPGSGKTTLLLELARDLIALAEQDVRHPIPVVFNLSSWATKRQPLKAWLVEELNTKYDVPRKLAQAWMQADAVLLLLDGLDEVAAEHRVACVEAINAYRLQEAEAMVPLAVCSRVADYKVLTTKLRLQGAIVVQPLTKPMIQTYFEYGGSQFKAIRLALRDDPTLWELLDTPLLLSIVILVYKDKTVQTLRAQGTPEERRRQLFDDYISVMFARRGKQATPSLSQTKHQLSWLAKQMAQHYQTVYYIELMQLDWLSKEQHNTYTFLRRSLDDLGVILTSGLGVGLSIGLAFGLEIGLVFGLVFGLGVGLGSELSRRKFIQSLLAANWPWHRDIQAFFVGVGAGESLLIWLLFRQVFWLILGLSLGVGVGLRDALAVKAPQSQDIHGLGRSWLGFGLGLGLVVGVVLGADGQLGMGLRFGFGFGLIVGLIGGLGSAIIGLIDLVGRTFLLHYILRYLLYRDGFLPLNLVPFLDYCVDRIFLRKVGSGYIFIHRLLMEHFASLYTQRGLVSQRPRSSDRAAD